MTSRTIDSDLQAGAESGVFGYLLFVKLAFPSGTVYLHNGIGSYTWGGNTYLGVGSLGSIDALEETLEVSTRPIKLILSSIDQGILDAVKTDNVYGKNADVYMGSINAEQELIGTPQGVFSGWMDNVEILEGADDNAISIAVRSRASRLKRKNNKRYTLEDHQHDYPGDTFFKFLPYLQELSLTWGGEEVIRGGQGGDNIGPGTNPGGGFGTFPGGRPRPGGGYRRQF